MTDSSWEIHETAITYAECDREGQRSVHKMGHFFGTGGTVVGPTIQEAHRTYLVDASTASQEGMCLGQVSCDAVGSTKRKRDTKSQGGYLTKEGG